MFLISATLATAGLIAYGEGFAAWATRRWPAQGVLSDWNGHQLHWRDIGQTNALPVLMIHGASANGREFSTNLVPQLADEGRLIIPDRPGHGHSSRPPNAHRLALQANAMAHILDAARIERAVVVGHSFGGAVALRLALDHPERVASLVLIAPASHPFPGKTTIHNRLAANPVYGPAYSRMAPLAGPLLSPRAIQNVFAPSTPPLGYPDALGLPLLFRPRSFRANAMDMSAANREFAAQTERYQEITAPMVIYSGSQDHVLSPRIHARELAQSAPNATLIKLSEDGHMPHHNHAETIAGTVRELMRAETAKTALDGMK